MAETAEEVRRAGLGDLSKLPDALICYVLFILEDIKDVYSASQTSRLLRVYACEEPLWLHLYLRHQEGFAKFQSNWRQSALTALRAAGRTIPDASWQAAAVPPTPVAGFNSDFLYRRWFRCHVDLSTFAPPEQHLQKVPAADMTAGELLARFDEPCLPALLEGLVGDWQASELQFERLVERYGTSDLSVSTPLATTRMTLASYQDYVKRQHDEEPLYIFDDRFSRTMPEILDMYKVPRVFDQDHLALLGEAMRPPHRWVVVGPARSGAPWHVDPFLTSAWNVLLQGRKRWALYPPDVVPPGVFVKEDNGRGSYGSEDNLTSLQWFLEVYPLLPVAQRPLELVQMPGETVFVPGGWWHCVLNMDEMQVAVTQNFVSSANLERVVANMALGTPRCNARMMAGRLYDPTTVAGWRDLERACGRAPPSRPARSGVSGGEAAPQLNTAALQPNTAAVVANAAHKRASCQGLLETFTDIPPAKLQCVGLPHLKNDAAAPAGDAPALAAGQGGLCGADSAAKQEGGHDSGAMQLDAAAEADDDSDDSYSCFSSCSSDDSSDDEDGVCGPDGTPLELTVAVQLLSVQDGQDKQYGAAAGTSTCASAADEAPSGQGVQIMGRGAGGGETAGRAAGRDGSAPRRQLLPAQLFQRSKILGRWLHALWTQHAELRPAIHAVMEQYLHPSRWRALLDAICCAAGRPACVGDEASRLLPMCGVTALVWLLDDVAVKVYTVSTPKARLLSSLESFICGLDRAPAGPPPPSWLPQALHLGTATVSVKGSHASPSSPALDHATAVLRGPAGSAAAAAAPAAAPTAAPAAAQAAAPMKQSEPVAGGVAPAAATFPFVISRRVAGGTLRDTLHKRDAAGKLALAQALGRLLAQVHFHGAAQLAPQQHPTADATSCPASDVADGTSSCPANGAGGGVPDGSFTTLASVDWLALLRGGHTVWHDRGTHVWTSLHGLLPLSEPRRPQLRQQQQQQCQSAPMTTTTESGAPMAVATGSSAMDTSSLPSVVDAAAVMPGSTNGTANVAGTSQPTSKRRRPASGVPPAWSHLAPADRRWLPFVEYVRLRRAQMEEVLPHIKGSRTLNGLPSRLVGQLATYFPLDPASVLLGCSTSNAAKGANGAPQDGGSGRAVAGSRADGASAAEDEAVAMPFTPPTSAPCLLHNDVTSDNTLVVGAEEGANGTSGTAGGTDGAAVELRLLDFGDAGHGDPLFDFMAVAGSCLKWDTELLTAAWAAYRSTGAVRLLWPPGRGGSSSVSKGGAAAAAATGAVALSQVALCYSLIHEDEPLLDVLRKVSPEKLDGSATLEELASAAWGFLDVASE